MEEILQRRRLHVSTGIVISIASLGQGYSSSQTLKECTVRYVEQLPFTRQDEYSKLDGRVDLLISLTARSI